MRTVLVSLPSGAGVVRFDDGSLLVTDEVSEGGGTYVPDDDRFRPVKSWVDGHHCVVGGLLAPGAVTAEAVDDHGAHVPASVAEGAYAAMLEQPNDGREPIVCCRDAAGGVMRRPLAGAYPCHPVTDAEEPCPACGAIDYEECVLTESWRGGPAGPDGSTIASSPIVVCRACGHEESAGGIIRFSSPDDEDDAARTERIARQRAERGVQRWYEHKLTLRAVTFPVYAADGWPAQISGSGSHGDDLTELTIAHCESEGADLVDEPPRIEVTTSTDKPCPDEVTAARQELERLVHDELEHPHSPDLSDAAITLWFLAHDRLRRAAALAATPSEAQIRIDGAPHAFVALTTPSGRWVAVRRHDDLTITIAARDVAPAAMAIEPIADPNARLLGPEPPEP